MEKVLIIMGSDSDLKVMAQAQAALEQCGVESDIHIASAHRTPDKVTQLVKEAEARGCSAIIAGAGLAAHLPGVVAAFTTLPVIGVPLAGGTLGGTDALHSVVQMPKGIPVATVAINGAYNAGLLAAQIIATSDERVRAKLQELREEMARQVEAKDAKLQQSGVGGYFS